jgi:hypothetical protein
VNPTHIHHHRPVQRDGNREAVHHMVQLASKSAALPKAAVHSLHRAAVAGVLQIVQGSEHAVCNFFPQPSLFRNAEQTVFSECAAKAHKGYVSQLHVTGDAICRFELVVTVTKQVCNIMQVAPEP